MTVPYPRATDFRPPPSCTTCGADIDVSTQPIPNTDRVAVIEWTCPADIEHNPQNAAEYGGRLETQWRP